MQKKILVIDDDSDTVDIITYVLSEEHYEIISSKSWIIITEISSIMPDLILLDHWLDGTLGSKLCKKLKANSQTSKIPVVLISATMGIDSVASECGADAHISKPFDIDYLSEVVALILNINA